MGTLLEMQPEDREPVEYTHFDCWNNNPLDDDVDLEDISVEFCTVLKNWSKNLKCPVLWDSRQFSGFYELMFDLGFELVKDLVILDLLRYGFDVFEGAGYIEIYKGD